MAEITVGHALVPDGYTFTDREQRLLDWSHVQEQMRAAINYWVATTRPDGRRHVTPTWAVWHEDRLYFDGSPETRRMKNTTANSNVAVHLEDGTRAIIVEGIAGPVGKTEGELAEALVVLYTAKYESLGYAPKADQWDKGGLFVVEPALALAWTEFGVDMTRWVIQR